MNYIYDISLLKKVNVFANLKATGTFILQWPHKVEELEEKLPSSVKREIAGKRLKFFTFTASAKDSIAERLAAFFTLSGVLPEIGGLSALIASAKNVCNIHPQGSVFSNTLNRTSAQT